MRTFLITYELSYDDAPPTTTEEVTKIADGAEDLLSDTTGAEGCRCLDIMKEDPTRHFLGCALRDAHPAPGKDGAHAALVSAIRTFTTEGLSGGPNGEAERLLLALSLAIRDGHIHRARGLFQDMCSAMSDDTKALRVAAERFFGGDFRAPVTARVLHGVKRSADGKAWTAACDEPDPAAMLAMRADQITCPTCRERGAIGADLQPAMEVPRG